MACFFYSDTYFDLMTDISHDLTLLRHWFGSHKMLSSDICTYANTTETLKYNAICSKNCFHIEIVSNFKYLGLLVDNKLNWFDRTLLLKTFLFTSTRIMYFLKQFCSKELLTCIY